MAELLVSLSHGAGAAKCQGIPAKKAKKAEEACGPELAAGEAVELEISGLSSDGRGVARLNGLVFLVGGGLPGQLVRAEVTRLRPRLVEAEALETLRPSPDERSAPCRHAGLCGGCPWQSLDYARQLFWKEQIVRDALVRLGGLKEPPIRPILPSPERWGCRNKMEFAFGREGVGLRERRSHRIVPVTDCLMQSPETMRLLAAARELDENQALTPDFRRPRFLVIRRVLSPEGFLAELIVGPDLREDRRSELRGDRRERGRRGRRRASRSDASFAESSGDFADWGQRVASALRERVPSLRAFALSERRASGEVAQGERILYQEGTEGLRERIGPLSLRLGPSSFFQVNSGAAALLYDAAARMLADEPVTSLWDAYCGVGSVGLYLAHEPGFAGGDEKAEDVGEAIPGKGAEAGPSGSRLLGLESVPGAVELARRNAEDLHIRADFICGDVGDSLAKRCRELPLPDVLVVDPPRAGLDERVTRLIVQRPPARLLYISCNPATLARDAARLAPVYTLQSVQPVDLFPQTPHVESVSLFTRLR